MLLYSFIWIKCGLHRKTWSLSHLYKWKIVCIDLWGVSICTAGPSLCVKSLSQRLILCFIIGNSKHLSEWCELILKKKMIISAWNIFVHPVYNFCIVKCVQYFLNYQSICSKFWLLKQTFTMNIQAPMRIKYLYVYIFSDCKVCKVCWIPEIMWCWFCNHGYSLVCHKISYIPFQVS